MLYINIKCNVIILNYDSCNRGDVKAKNVNPLLSRDLENPKDQTIHCNAMRNALQVLSRKLVLNLILTCLSNQGCTVYLISDSLLVSS